MTEPHWERGYRCHGYWIGTTRYGRVSIGPGRVPKIGGYRWEFSPPGFVPDEGTCDLLIQGKRQVEKLYGEWLKIPEDERNRRVDHAPKAWK